MKKNLKDSVPISRKGGLLPCIFLLLLSLLWACANPDHDHASGPDGKYTCPMHPEVVQEGPGSCPVCGMDLVPRHSGADTAAPGTDLEQLLQPVNRTIVADIRTVAPVKRAVDGMEEAYGTVMYDTRRAYTIPVRYGGRVEKLYVHYNFETVKQGQKILEMYSPEIVTAQNELLYLLESDPGNRQLLEASRQKLRLLGLTRKQISRLEETGSASYSLPVYSPYSGYIYEASAGDVPQSLPGEAPTRLGIREGMYLKKGETAFTIINTDQVWAEFNLYPQTVPHVKAGDSVILSSDFNRDLKIRTTVSLVQPYYQNGENFTTIRVCLANKQHRFMPGQLVTARFTGLNESAWWLPATAVTDLGTKKVVFVKEGGVFHPRVINTGRITSDWAEVVSGLSPGDSVAYHGHFLVDSEGFIKTENKNR